ncbi:hypothetical protein SO694_00051054 [Aureococcus anophagefferens]|uniref:Protein kinase domain-containing protein n=1 Tax=Aureococcus anophagefferens TaxID=44056 RepID=A0ABR1FY45_AURAN
MAPPPESPYTRAVEKADQLLERGLIDPGRYRDIVAGDAQFHIEAARFERDAALRQLEDLSPERAARPRRRLRARDASSGARGDVHFDLVGERLHTIKENDRSSSARSSSASRRLPSSKKATKLRAWETARSGVRGAEPAARGAVAPPRPSAPPRPRGRISEQPFSPTDFERQRRVGRGGFGVVYLVRGALSPAGAAYAMKVLDKSRILRGGGAAQARLERDVLRVLRHPFVARLRYAFQTETRRAPRTSKLRPDFHGTGGHVALCDFGIAAVGALDGDDGGGATPRRRSFCGTVEYMAPELLRGESHSRPWTGGPSACSSTSCSRARRPSGGRRRPRDLFRNILRADPPPLPAAARAARAPRRAPARQGAASRLGTEGPSPTPPLRGPRLGRRRAQELARRRPCRGCRPTLPSTATAPPLRAERGPLPRLDDDGESDDDDDRARDARARAAPARPLPRLRLRRRRRARAAA